MREERGRREKEWRGMGKEKKIVEGGREGMEREREERGQDRKG